MKFYRVHLRTPDDSSAGYEWTTSRDAAEKIKRKHDKEQREGVKAEAEKAEGEPWAASEAEVDGPHEIEPTRAGICAALNLFADHPNNG